MGKYRGPVRNAVPKVVEEPKQDILEPEVEAKEEPVVEETEILADAIVDGVEMSLNIRKDPKVVANNQIAILHKGTKIIVVNPGKPILKDGIEWFKVRLLDHDPEDPTGNGYAMKKYIKVI